MIEGWSRKNLYRLHPGMPATLTSSGARALVRRRDGDACHLCGRLVIEGLHQGNPDQATLDHIIERQRGGSNLLANVKLAHAACNVRRSNPPMSPALAVLIKIVCGMVEGRSSGEMLNGKGEDHGS